MVTPVSGLVVLAALAGNPQSVPTAETAAVSDRTVSPAPKPSPPLSDEMRGDIYMARKMYREAIEAYKQMPQSPIVVNKIGIAYHQQMQLDQARRHYERAIKMNPKYSEAINNLGTVHYAKKSYRRAVNQYKKALKVNPNSASILSNLGTAHFARKKYKDAFVAYQRALELDPEVFEHRSTQGVLLQERSVAEKARFHYFLSKTYAKAGQVDRALLYMRKAIEEGFKERNKFKEDPEFANMQELPEFQQLLTMEVRVL
ncbi:MAG: tetratricopeptide repeat protein [Bryobacteraceae bacterium]|nr:tetratricopeptide repeat protein [Bryobacteraceae bacterium]